MISRTTLLGMTVCALMALMAILLASPVPRVDASAAPAPKAVDTGLAHTCALTAGGGVRCWGDNFYGQLGDGTTTDRSRPVDVCASGSGASCVLLTGVVSISTGDNHSCAVIDDGSARCWGLNKLGALGDGTITQRSLPVAVCTSGSGSGCSRLRGIVQISAGSDYTCAVIGTYPEGGVVKCWGGNSFGQLGDGTTDAHVLPAFVCATGVGSACPGGVALFGMTSVSAGGDVTCARAHDGTARCWGHATNVGDGAGGTGAQTHPVVVCNTGGGAGCAGGAALGGVVNVGAGDASACALLDAGRVKCWGNNFFGRLGDGTTNNSSNPVDVCYTGAGAGCAGGGALFGVVSLDVGIEHACVLLAGTGMLCWGGGYGLHPVDGTSTNQTGFTSISTSDHRCGLNNAGVLYCWGNNSAGQVGNGTTSVWETAPVVVGGFAFSSSTAMTGLGAYGAACGRLVAGTLKCWGENSFGEVGDGTTTNRLNPVNVCFSGSGSGCPKAAGFVQTTAGLDHSCGLTMFYPYGGSVQCWGYNFNGELGDGLSANRTIPAFVCAVGTGASCSGGYALSGLTSVVGGQHHTCGLIHDGTVRCWGDNAFGELGDSTTTDRHNPVTVCDSGEFCTGLTGVVALSAGDHHTCALLVTGLMQCWGDNTYGQLGDGTTTTRAIPKNVCNTGTGAACGGGAALFGIVAISVGDDHSCALLVGSVVKCWGKNDNGQLGDGTLTNRSNPADVCSSGAWNGSTCAGGSSLTDASEVNAGTKHTCVRSIEPDADASSARCFGDNLYGQLGDGTTTDRALPVYVCASGSGGGCPKQLNLSKVDAANGFTCALTSAGKVRCWGSNAAGSLGDGTTTNRSIPVDLVLSVTDSDGDGCSDSAEMVTTPGSELNCGLRNSKNPFDYFNPSNDGLNRVDDILLVVHAYFQDDADSNPGLPPYYTGGSPVYTYNPDTDRSFVGPNAWNLGPPNGLQRVDDILNSVKQYFHDVP